MKKIQLLLFVFYTLCAQIAEAQNAIDIPGMSNVLPPAPNAYELTKYSGLPINKSSGSVNLSIPLGEINQGNVRLPISLFYSSGNGVKINQIASRAGMGWVLNAGGVITRTVAGLPDEKAIWVVPPSNLGNSQETLDYLEKVSDNITYDSQPDVFSFNFNGYSGRFILMPTDKEKVILLTPTPLKIITNFKNEHTDDWTFKITDPEGISYCFGGTKATEKSKTKPYGQSCGKSFGAYEPTAWYLKSIEEHGVAQVDFQYSPILFNYLADVSQTMIRTPKATMQTQYTQMPENIQYPCPGQYQDLICGSRLWSSGVILNAIVGRTMEVQFTYAPRLDVDGEYLLDSVKFIKEDIGSATFSTYDSYKLSYINSNNNTYVPQEITSNLLTKRPFLSKLSRTALTLNQENQDYLLSYYNINDLPARLSFSQDYWGYFNGTNNNYLLPQSTDPLIQEVFPIGVMANREPNGMFAKYGLLSSITYPSGGRDSLMYEPNTIYEERMIPPVRTTYTNYVQGSGNRAERHLSFVLNSGMTQNVQLIMKSDYSGTGLDDGIHQYSLFKLYDANNILVYELKLKLNESQSSNVTIDVGNYTLEVYAYGTAAIANVALEYKIAGSLVNANFEAGGVRVAKNISHPLLGPPLTKTYIYASLNYQEQSSGTLQENAIPNLYYTYSPILPSEDQRNCTYITGYSVPSKSLEFSSGSHIFYKDVIELRDGKWENGGTAYKYNGDRSLNGNLIRGYSIPNTPVQNMGFEPGMETQVKVFSTTGGIAGNYTTKTISEKIIHYVNDSRLTNQIDAYLIRKRYPFSANGWYVPFDYKFLPFDVARYSIFRNWVYADTITTTNYNLQGENPLVNTQVFLYNNPDHLQISETKTLMSNGRSNRVVMDYPHDMVANGILSPYSSMIANNIIAFPIVKKRYIDNTFIQQTTTNYADWGNGIFEPQALSHKLSSNDEVTYVRFHAFDADGNLLEQSREGGVRLSYKYGYKNTRLVAQCKNALPTEFFSENFEEQSTSPIGFSHTGIRSYIGDFAIDWTPPNSRQYKITYWYFENDKWNYSEQDYIPAMELNLGYAIDDVNVFPADAQLSTYTYDLACGITSQTDTKGMTIYYEYDDFQRLKNVKDQSGNILKSYNYHYQN